MSRRLHIWNVIELQFCIWFQINGLQSSTFSKNQMQKSHATIVKNVNFEKLLKAAKSQQILGLGKFFSVVSSWY